MHTPFAVTDAPDDLCVITSYYNPAGYKTKQSNFNHFASGIKRAGLRLLVIECCFGTDSFKLAAGPDVIQIRARDAMWQKERLLNLVVNNIPSEFTKVVWLDCDILFENPSWAIQTSSALDRYAMVQPFDSSVRLARDKLVYEGVGDIRQSFCSVVSTNPEKMLQGRYLAHGHTGFGWAARIDLIRRHRLYDACLAGNGDHLMAHGICGDWESPCIDNMIGRKNRHREYFNNWAKRISADVRGNVSAVPGRVVHLWHGDRKDRRYGERSRELIAFDYNPETDVKVGDDGCWEWNSDKPELHRWAAEYFGSRNEDGDLHSVNTANR